MKIESFLPLNLKHNLKRTQKQSQSLYNQPLKQVNSCSFPKNNKETSKVFAANSYLAFFTGQCKTPLYSIDKDGNYERFDSLAEAAQKLGIKRVSISNCINGRQFNLKEHNFIKASEVEYTDESGNLRVDEDKIKKYHLTCKTVNFNSKHKGRAIYFIDFKKNVRRFDAIKYAAQELECSDYMIWSSCNDDYRGCKLGAFVYADQVEFHKDGKLVLDKKELQRLVQNKFGKKDIKLNLGAQQYNNLDNQNNLDIPKLKRKKSYNYGRIYALFPNGSIEEYASLTIAAQSLNVEEKLIIDSLNGRLVETPNNCVFSTDRDA